MEATTHDCNPMRARDRSPFADQHAARLFLPYCLQRLSGNRYILLNREYKPIGWLGGPWSNWLEFPVTLEVEGLTAEVAQQISAVDGGNPDRIYFFTDACKPWSGEVALASYELRLSELFSLPIRYATEPVGSRV